MRYVDIGANGLVVGVSSGSEIYYRTETIGQQGTGSSWNRIDGHALQVVIDSKGKIVARNSAHELWYKTTINGEWARLTV